MPTTVTENQSGTGNPTNQNPAPGAQELNAQNDPAAAASTEADNAAWDEKTKAYIASLRKEAASNRTKAKDLESKVSKIEGELGSIKNGLKTTLGITDDEKPEDKIKDLSSKTEQLSFRNAILESAVEHGIANDGLDYFQFLVAKEVEKLNDNEVLSDEALAEIAKRTKQATTKAPATTSVGNGGASGGSAPAPGNSGSVTLDQFLGMTITEKSKLYNSSPEAYSQLFQEARRNKKI